jgi:small subunit ribosomal protein S6
MKLAYNIDKHNKARYILLNFEANNEILEELSSLIKFNDNILRHLFIAQDKKITEPSIMMQSRERA